MDANNVEFQPDPQRPVDIRLVQHGLCAWDSFWCVVENGINQAIESLLEIEPLDDTQLDLKNMCLEDLREFQNGNLLALRRAVE